MERALRRPSGFTSASVMCKWLNPAAARGQRHSLRDGGGTRPFDSVSLTHVGDALRSIAALNVCTLACSLMVNVNPLVDCHIPEQIPNGGILAQRHNAERRLTPY